MGWIAFAYFDTTNYPAWGAWEANPSSCSNGIDA